MKELKTKRIIIMIAVIAIIMLGMIYSVHRIHTLSEQTRILRENQDVLLNSQKGMFEQNNTYSYRDSLSGATVERVRLDVETIKNNYTDLSNLCKELKIRMKDVESATEVANEMAVNIKAPIKDTVFIVNNNKVDARAFAWDDNYVRVDGTINEDSVDCNVISYDTIKQIVHVKPKCFLGIKFGIKEIRQEMLCSNPHSRITYAEYLDVLRE